MELPYSRAIAGASPRQRDACLIPGPGRRRHRGSRLQLSAAARHCAGTVRGAARRPAAEFPLGRRPAAGRGRSCASGRNGRGFRCPRRAGNPKDRPRPDHGGPPTLQARACWPSRPCRRRPSRAAAARARCCGQRPGDRGRQRPRLHVRPAHLRRHGALRRELREDRHHPGRRRCLAAAADRGLVEGLRDGADRRRRLGAGGARLRARLAGRARARADGASRRLAERIASTRPRRSGRRSACCARGARPAWRPSSSSRPRRRPSPIPARSTARPWPGPWRGPEHPGADVVVGSAGKPARKRRGPSPRGHGGGFDRRAGFRTPPLAARV